MVREIVIWPDSVLAKEAEPVTVFDAGLRELLKDMGETMLRARGAGLAAPQIGHLVRAVTVLVRRMDVGTDAGEFLFNDKGEPMQVLQLVNPVITARKGSQLMREGCLSLPGYFEQVRRATWVRVEAQDATGQRVEVEGDGILAHALQHELEHLDGVVFVDHLSSLKRNLARTRFAKAKAKGMRYRADVPVPQDFTQLQ